MPHWLSWRCGTDLRTAREHVRVARSLTALPRTTEEFGRGTLSYSKVRAIARVADPATEGDLVDIALAAPAAHVERLCAGLRRAADRDAPGDNRDNRGDRAEHRCHTRWRWDDETGELVIWGRLRAVDGAVLLAGLTRAEHERTRTGADDRAHDGSAEPRDTPAPAPADGSAEPHPRAGPDAPTSSPDLTGPPPNDIGPALVALAEQTLASGSAPVHAPSAEIVLHRDATGTRVADGPALDDAAAEEAACSGIVREVVTRDGCVLAWGRARRRPSSAQLRALYLRDGGCRTPGCGRTRFLHAHHVRGWRRGGPTDLDNLVLLCGSCHRNLHEGGFTITAIGGQRFTFHRDGSPWLAAPSTSGTVENLLRADLDPDPLTPHWGGEPLDLSYATEVLLTSWRARTQAA